MTGDRLAIPLDEGSPDLRVMLEIRHVRTDTRLNQPGAPAACRNFLPADHERMIRVIFAEPRSRQLSH